MARPAKKIVDGKLECSKCKEWKDVDQFYTSQITTTGRQSQCKACQGHTKGSVGRYPVNPVKNGKKKCLSCGKIKLLERFEKNKNSHLGRSNRCHDCNIERTNEWASRNIDNYLKRLVNSHHQNRKFRTKHRMKSGARPKEFWKDSCVTYKFLKRLWKKQDGKCAITGIGMTHAMGQGSTQTNVSIDRIDSSIGYETGNVQLVCKAVNTIKNELKNDDLIFWCERIIHGLQKE